MNLLMTKIVKRPNMKKKSIFEVICKENPIAIMKILLKNSNNELYVTSVAEQANCTHSHAVKILQKMHG